MQTTCRGAAGSEVAYEYHDDGYISLEPGEPEKEAFEVIYAANGSVVSDSRFDESMVGKYIWIAGDWHEIIHVSNSDEAVTRWNPGEGGTGNAIVAMLNRITVVLDEGSELSKLEIEYQPKVR